MKNKLINEKEIHDLIRKFDPSFKLDKNRKADLDKLLKMEKKINILVQNFFSDKEIKENLYRFSLCLTELFHSSNIIKKYIKQISEQKIDMGERELDYFMTLLINLKVWIYDEMVDWIKDLRKPLNRMITETGRKMDELEKKNKE